MAADEYPQGAVRSIEGIPANAFVWKASRTFRSCNRYWSTGIIGTDCVTGEEDTYRFYWFELCWTESRSTPDHPSLLDANISRRNNYNDWFLFAREADALAHAGIKSDSKSEAA